MAMTWNAEQESLLRDLVRFIRDPHRFVYRMWGKAGTGKTTLAAAIRDKFVELAWIAIAYTGKAASRLRAKDWHNASTIHSQLYLPGSASTARLHDWEARVFEIEQLLKSSDLDDDVRVELLQEQEDLGEKIAAELEALKDPVFVFNQDTELVNYDVIVVDEVSMVGTKEGRDLENLCRKHGIKLLLMGDPYQLPPVGQKAWFMGTKPDFELTQIMRQAQDDPIIYLAELARTRKTIPLGSYGDSKVVQRIDTDTPENEYHPSQMAEMVECDQVLCGTNATRTFVNGRMRKERGYTDLLEVGEKLICLANSKRGFFNGTMWIVQDILEWQNDRGRVVVSLLSDEEGKEPVVATLHQKALRGDIMHFTELYGGEAMVTAQAVTVHKFQGSEAPHVVILDEAFTARENAHRWLYTALTRPQKRATLMTRR